MARGEGHHRSAFHQQRGENGQLAPFGRTYTPDTATPRSAAGASGVIVASRPPSNTADRAAVTPPRAAFAHHRQ
jgi:hypothetical protein